MTDYYGWYLKYERALGIIDFLQVAHGRRDLFEVHHVISYCLGMNEIETMRIRAMRIF